MDIKKEERLLGKEERLIIRKQHLVHKLEREPEKKELYTKEILSIIHEQLKLEKNEIRFDPSLENAEEKRKEKLNEQVKFLNEKNMQKLKISIKEEEDTIRKLERYEKAKEPKRNFHFAKPLMAVAVIVVLVFIFNMFMPGKLFAMGSRPVKQLAADDYHGRYLAYDSKILPRSYWAHINEKDSTILFKLNNQVVGGYEVFYSRAGKLIAFLTKDGRVVLGEPPIKKEQIEDWRERGLIRALDEDAKVLEEKYKDYTSPK